MEKSDDSQPERDPDTIQFPDWSGMDDSTNRISPEAALKLCEDYQARFGALVNSQPRPEKCLVEFVL
jgi:hypothetical protein